MRQRCLYQVGKFASQRARSELAILFNAFIGNIFCYLVGYFKVNVDRRGAIAQFLDHYPCDIRESRHVKLLEKNYFVYSIEKFGLEKFA
jgi:hypothetical protein